MNGNALETIIEEISRGNYFIEDYTGTVSARGFDTIVTVGSLPIAVNSETRSFGFYGPNGDFKFFGRQGHVLPSLRERYWIRKFFRALRLYDIQFNDWSKGVRGPLAIADAAHIADTFLTTGKSF